VIIPPHLARLPAPSPEAQALSDQLCALIAREIEAAGGWISFARYMELALYAPALGYYSAGSRKLGEGGDFVTAPEMSPLFARCMARQLMQMHGEGLRNVLEIGAGSGALAADLLLEMSALGCAPDAYCILELSADLRERQREQIARRAPGLIERVRWLDVLPAQFEGVVLANEVLDATPAHQVRSAGIDVEEVGVVQSNPLSRMTGEGGGEGTASGLVTLCSASRPTRGALADAAALIGLPPDYETEINLTARALVSSLARLLTRGVLLFIDYGFPAREFYHPQRASGTLMCHYRHHAHDDPFAFVGLQDITTHVDFSAVADAAIAGGATLAGYTTQANFLINCGITELLAQTPASDARAYAPLAAQAQKLLSPAEMGELFKVIALVKNIDPPLLGFARGDKSHTL
jgi:SAM-dependent MidA family methyltransferase